MSVIQYEDYLVKEKMPLFWCAGCGHGIVLGAIVRAFAELQLDKRETVVVTGIGCWGKADDYIDTNTFHGTHGRALGFATGIKLANPKLNVLALMGDGDGATIGGNHLIHAARRNVDITAIIVNNFNYGMTGGQYSGTTPESTFTSTSRYGHIEPGFDLCNLVTASGAPFVARGTVHNAMQLQKLIVEGIKKKGFSFVEAIAPCPTHYGRLNNMKTAPEMLHYIKDHSISIKQAAGLSEPELENKYVLGKFVDREQLDYSAKYKMLQEDCKKVSEQGGFSREG
jgi:2-oxoglutarate/2-oxoacid ferredoxin oxidoreductase subunit beta